MSFLFPSKKFKVPLNTAVFTTIHVMKEKSPIVWISHELDGDWQFMGSETFEDYTKIAMVVSLKQVIKIDKSILKVADLPIGYCATRKRKSDKWTVSKIEYSKEELRQFGYHCSKCGLYHKEIPMAYGADAPFQYYQILEVDRDKRCILSSDHCIIDNSIYFIRGELELPVENNADKFRWNLWVLVSEADFNRIRELWLDDNRILEKPYPGKLANQLEPYPNMLDLPVLLITQSIGYAPTIELKECDHPLYFEQESGINMDRVVDFAKKILYDH